MLPVFSLFSLLSGAGWAAPFDSGSLDTDLSVEQQLTRDRLLTQFDAHFFPERVEDVAMLDRIEMTVEHRGFSCLTGLVRDLKDNWELFSVHERAEMTGILAPWKRDLLESSPPPPSNADSPCVNPSDGYVDDRENQVLGDHFSVEWDSGTNQTKAENFLESLEFSWEMQIDEWDWEEPTGTSRYPMLAYIAQGNYASAYTTVDWCSGQGWVPYIVAFAGSFSSGNWYQDMAGHEFNHAVQYAYGYAHEFWWWEATATWVEEYVYDSHNSWSDYVWGYSENPWIALNSSSQSDTDIFYHMYGMAQLGFYLDQHVGGHEMVRGTWEVAAEDGGTYSLWLPDAIEDMGYDWSEIYTGFMAANTVNDYEQRSSFWDVDIEEKISSLPATGESSNQTRPQSLGQNYFRFKESACESGKYLEVSFSGDSSVEWYAILVEADGNSVGEVVTLELEDGTGTGDIACTDDDLYLVVSPSDPESSGYNYNWERADDWDYTWEAELIDADESSAAEEDGSGIFGKKGDGEGWGCGCATTSGPGAGGLFALPLLVWFRRRRTTGT